MLDQVFHASAAICGGRYYSFTFVREPLDRFAWWLGQELCGQASTKGCDDEAAAYTALKQMLSGVSARAPAESGSAAFNISLMSTALAGAQFDYIGRLETFMLDWAEIERQSGVKLGNGRQSGDPELAPFAGPPRRQVLRRRRLVEKLAAVGPDTLLAVHKASTVCVVT